MFHVKILFNLYIKYHIHFKLGLVHNVAAIAAIVKSGVATAMKLAPAWAVVHSALAVASDSLSHSFPFHFATNAAFFSSAVLAGVVESVPSTFGAALVHHIWL